MNVYYFTEKISLGDILFAIDLNGVIKELWLGKQVAIHKMPVQDDVINSENVPLKTLHSKEKLIAQLTAYEEGQIFAFDLNFAPAGTLFQQEVWEMLLKIPYGSCRTYGDIANDIAKKRGLTKFSAQAVGQAIGKNPLSILIPCHRVIGKSGDLIGYSGGIDIKKGLLEIEKKGVCRRG